MNTIVPRIGSNWEVREVPTNSKSSFVHWYITWHITNGNGK